MNTNHHNDVTGFPLEIGDLIAVTIPGYSDLCIKKVFGFTPKKIKLGSNQSPSVDIGQHRFPGQVCLIRRPIK